MNAQALDEMSDAAAHAAQAFAMTSAVNGTAKSSHATADVGLSDG